MTDDPQVPPAEPEDSASSTVYHFLVSTDEGATFRRIGAAEGHGRDAAWKTKFPDDTKGDEGIVLAIPASSFKPRRRTLVVKPKIEDVELPSV